MTRKQNNNKEEAGGIVITTTCRSVTYIAYMLNIALSRERFFVDYVMNMSKP